MASSSLTGPVPGKPWVDRKLGAILSATIGGKTLDSWYVYLVFDRSQHLRYVGQTGALFSRFSQHKAAGRLGDRAQQQGDDWDAVMAIACGSAVQVKAHERKLIHRFHPPDNRKCETKGCRHYLDGSGSIPATRTEVNRDLRARSIGTT